MIAGLVIIISLLVTRLNATPNTSFPTDLKLPAQTQMIAYTQGPNWYAVVTAKNEIFIFDLDKNLIQSIEVQTPQAK